MPLYNTKAPHGWDRSAWARVQREAQEDWIKPRVAETDRRQREEAEAERKALEDEKAAVLAALESNKPK